MKATYTGYRGGTYLAYMDLDTGKVLTVEAGGTYNIQAVSGPDLPPDFVPVEEEEEIITPAEPEEE